MIAVTELWLPLAPNLSGRGCYRAPPVFIMGGCNTRPGICHYACSLPMHPPVIQLDPATPADARRAFDEVKHFATTDMGRQGTHRWTYRVLNEPDLTQELTRLSGARSVGRTDFVSFQPCTSFEAESQDRPIVEDWHIAGKKWLFTAVLDGMEFLIIEIIFTNGCRSPKSCHRRLCCSDASWGRTEKSTGRPQRWRAPSSRRNITNII